MVGLWTGQVLGREDYSSSGSGSAGSWSGSGSGSSLSGSSDSYSGSNSRTGSSDSGSWSDSHSGKSKVTSEPSGRISGASPSSDDSLSSGAMVAVIVAPFVALVLIVGAVLVKRKFYSKPATSSNELLELGDLDKADYHGAKDDSLLLN